MFAVGKRAFLRIVITPAFSIAVAAAAAVAVRDGNCACSPARPYNERGLNCKNPQWSHHLKIGVRAKNKLGRVNWRDRIVRPLIVGNVTGERRRDTNIASGIHLSR